MYTVDTILVAAAVAAVFFLVRAVPALWRLLLGVPLMGFAVIALAVDGKTPYAIILLIITAYGVAFTLRDRKEAAGAS